MGPKNYDCEGQMSLFDAEIQSPAEVFYMTTGRTDYWQQSRNIVFNDDGIPVLVGKDEHDCEGCIFDTKNRCCSYPITKDDYCVLGNKKITNKLIKQLIDDLEAIYPEKIDGIEYQVWEHVPNLGKRLWLNIEAVGEEWDLTGIIDKYKQASLEVSVSAVPHFVGGEADVEGSSLYISTMWTTKGHKEVLEYDFSTKAAEPNACKFSGHTCNKEELWKVAETLDDPFCPHVCCRFCSTKQCGARCNGSEEPKKAAVDYETWHDIEEKPPEDAFCMFEYVWTRNQKEDSKGQCKGWWSNGKVKWLNMPWDIGKKRVIRWKYAEEPKEAAEPKCSKANECEAYPTGCGGSIEPCRFGGPFKWSEKAQEVEVRGICDDGYCPKCKIWLDDLVERCPECNTLLDWTHWRKLNE